MYTFLGGTVHQSLMDIYIVKALLNTVIESYNQQETCIPVLLNPINIHAQQIEEKCRVPLPQPIR